MKQFKNLKDLTDTYKATTGNTNFSVKYLTRFDMMFLFKIDLNGWVIKDFGFAIAASPKLSEVV